MYSLISAIRVRIALVKQALQEPDVLGREKVFIAGIHWNNEKILRDVWVPVVIQLASQIGPNNVFVSVQESGSWDDSKGALRFLDEQLAVLGVPKKIILDNTTHLDEISQAPGPGWLATPTGQIEMRRIPYLAKLRNLVLQPLLDMKDRDIHFDKILFLNDVAFNVKDVRTLLSTRGGEYAAACSLDFSKPPEFYDTFALRDSEGHEKLMQTWPYFRSRESRRALMYGESVPVESCWNGLEPSGADEPSGDECFAILRKPAVEISSYFR
ncbi:hypothetical protein NW762_010247 [Fusarium torreyae]|uniref:Polysaccharide export protein n=1 Tax=Fusarium torreyae TaxID=1237075 RepID=A0A9W8RUJ5_9HYPO|nr:hypothetical protein NW762_010247 [Fusarium torreyae]